MMSEVVKILLSLLGSYLVGAIPFGLIVVWVARRQDVRRIGSGRTGGTNVMRAAGWLAGAITGILDVLKGVATGWIARALVPDNPWVLVGSALLAVVGHNYSVFLIEKRKQGGIRFKGGAGGATAFGGAIALWPPIWMYILPIGVLVYLFIGYASVTTISVAVVTTVVFTVRALQGEATWIYVLYGVAVLGVVLYALRPNLERLRRGTERAVGLRAYLQKRHGQRGGSSMNSGNQNAMP